MNRIKFHCWIQKRGAWYAFGKYRSNAAVLVDFQLTPHWRGPSLVPMQEFIEKEVAEWYSQLENAGIKVWLDGGWGVDALLGEQTRPHKDLDIAINQKDVPQFMAFIASQGYAEVRRDSDYNIVMRDGLGREIDFHAFITDDAGNITVGIAYPNESLTGTGTIEGHPVRCIAPEYVVKFHTGYELNGKDYKDVLAVCARFGIALPAEYSKFIR